MNSRIHRHRDEEGLGLVEVLVAIFVLGLVLSSLASVLITSLRQTHRNETRVQATAVHQEILEKTVSLPWELIGLYSDDPGFSSTVTEDSDTFPTVSLGAAGGAGDVRVPEVEQIVTRGGVDYAVRTDIYTVDTDTKRVRTTVSWDALGQTHQSVFHATRAITGAEADDSFEVIHFAPSLSAVELDAAGRPTEEVEFRVQFTDQAHPGRIFVPTPTGELELALTPVDAEHTTFTATLGTADVVASGDQLVTLKATSAGTPPEDVTSAVTVTFHPEGTSTPVIDFDITHVSVTSPVRTQKSTGQACSYTVEIRVEGFTSGTDVVTLTHQYWNDATGSGNAPNADNTIEAGFRHASGSVGIYEVFIPATPDHYLRKDTNFQLIARATPAVSDETRERPLTTSATRVESCA